MDNGEIKVITANKDDTSLNQQWIMSPVVKTPYITPEREIIDENQQIRIESDTEDAVFYYTTDGTVPELKEDDQYTEPFYVTKDTTLNIIGTKAGYSNSELVTIELKMDDEIVAPAKADVESGAYAQKFNVNLSSETKDTKIYYTLDGTDPSYYNELYSNYGTIQIEKDTVLKTIAYKEENQAKYQNMYIQSKKNVSRRYNITISLIRKIKIMFCIHS